MIDDIRASLTLHRPHEEPDRENVQRAAVAAIFRGGASDAELLFIHRAEDPNDPWSGHMAFPGGRMEAGDADPLAAAVRETREEVGLDLETHGTRIGRLSDVPAVGRGRPLSLVITPFVFEARTVGELTPNHEVSAVVWVPFSFLLAYEHRSTVSYRRNGLNLELPCYQYGDHTIWGMTFGMVDELLSVVST